MQDKCQSVVMFFGLPECSVECVSTSEVFQLLFMVTSHRVSFFVPFA